jgi:uncharacterized surface protein with fasciclin (FAS1) repeats
MSLKRYGQKLVFLALAAILVMGLPIVAGAQEMANGITAPADGATVKGSVEVMGYASDPNFKKWQLDLLPGGDPNAAIFLALGNTAGEVEYALNTVGLPDGEHALRLRVVRDDSNYSEYTNKFTIANTGAATSQPKPSDTSPMARDIVDTAANFENFKTLVAAVQAAGLVDTLKSDGPFTVFAPNDAAFAKLPAGTVDGLLKDPKALANILTYHVLAGEVKAAAVKDGLSVNTVQGSPVKFSIMDGKPMINGANIISTDIMATNGVIHVIDSVILPPAAGAAAAETKPAAMPENGIMAPKAGETVSGEIEIMGHAMDPNFVRWELALLPGSDVTAPIFLTSGEEHGDFTYTLDTTGLPNGEHSFRLRVVRSDGNYGEYFSKFVIENK